MQGSLCVKEVLKMTLDGIYVQGAQSSGSSKD